MGSEAQKLKWHPQGLRGNPEQMRSPEFPNSLSCLQITKPLTFCVPQRFSIPVGELTIQICLCVQTFLQNSLCSKYNLTKLLKKTVKGTESNSCHISPRKCKRCVSVASLPDSSRSSWLWHGTYARKTWSSVMDKGQSPNTDSLAGWDCVCQLVCVCSSDWRSTGPESFLTRHKRHNTLGASL